jgi:hypothetical protein
MNSNSRRFLNLLAALAAVSVIASCAEGAKPAPEPKPEPASATSQPAATPDGKTPTPSTFNPQEVTAEIKTATFVDVRSLIETLNQIIRRQDYDAWLSHLTADYVKYYSDPEVLTRFSEYPVIKRQGIKLQTLHDYFVYVVYPSRQNDKVDDIEFVNTNLIKAITINSKGDRNILYMLEKYGDAWKIGIGR